jgi:RNA polymerase primary sigma factor
MAHATTSDRIYSQYYTEVGKHQVLTSTEERELLRRYYTCPNCAKPFKQAAPVLNCPACGKPTPPETADRATACTRCGQVFEIAAPPVYCESCGSSRDMCARNKLIETNLRFVIRRARKMTQDPEHFQKLVSAGNVGLVIALDKFSMDRATRFLTYAEWWIRKEMLDEIHASHLVHIPTHKQKDLRKAYKEGRYVCEHCGKRSESPDFEDNPTQCPKAEFHCFQLPIHDASAVMSPAVSIADAHMHTEATAEEGLIGEKTSALVREILRKICTTQRDLYILLAYFNIPEDDRRNLGKTLPQLSAVTQITPERVRQIKEKTVKHLFRELKRKNLVSA